MEEIPLDQLKAGRSGKKRADVLADAFVDGDVEAAVGGDFEGAAGGVGLLGAGIFDGDLAGACGDFHDFSGGGAEVERTR